MSVSALEHTGVGTAPRQPYLAQQGVKEGDVVRSAIADGRCRVEQSSGG